MSIVVVGGGVAGLTAVLHLAERHLTPILLEQHAHDIGGRLQDGAPVTFTQGEKSWTFPSEHGVHGIWSPYINLTTMLARHELLPEFVLAQDETWIQGHGQRIKRANIGRLIRQSYLPAPFHYLQIFLNPRLWGMLDLRDMAALPRVAGGLFSAMSIDPIAEQKALAGMSLADFMVGWSPNVRSLFAGLARNALAAHPEEVPASGFIAFLRFYTLLRRDAWSFAYLPSGGGTAVSQPLAQRAIELGATIHMGSRVTRIIPQEQGYQLEIETADGQRVETAEQLVLALSAPATQALLQTSGLIQPNEYQFPQGIPTAIIRIWFNRQPAPVSEAGIFSGDFIVDNFFWLHRLQTVYQDWARQTGGSAIEMHIYGPPEILAKPDATLLAQTLQDVHRAFPELRGHRIHMTLQRNEPTHTLFSVEENHLGVQTKWQNLFLCGDWVWHPVPALYLERAVSTGMAAANEVLQARNLPPWPLMPHPQPEVIAGWLSKQFSSWRQRKLRQRKVG